MATFYHGTPEIQPDGLQTLYLMNPGYVGYSADATSPSSNMVFMNAAGSPLNPASLSQHQQHQHFVGIPLHQPPASLPEVPTAQGLLPRVQYNRWNPSPANSSVDLTSQLGHRRTSTTPITSSQQGLSLSLSPQQPSYAIQPQPSVTTAAISPAGGEEMRFSGSSSSAASAASNGIMGLQGVLLGSKYLKTAQQLLDEVVNVGKGIMEESPKTAKAMTSEKANQESEDGNGGETSNKRPAADLTTAERQELQMKKAKLVNMLDEVEQRYRQYHHQMQIVISSFESIAGVGSARTYTALALQTISKQFRCLRDAISGQIRATSKNLGEEDCLVGSKTEGGSRLRFVDHHLRQQRALQQLGMMQHNAWRPQRGLPERSVSVLRAWLFEHFLHPYPKDSDKHMLAKQTGLTRNQVSNWFINARVRLWKPMVEEMYLEETKERERLNNNGDDKTSKSEDSASKSTAPPPLNSPSGTEHELQAGGNSRVQQTSYDEDEAEMIHSNLKKARSNDSLNQITLLHQHQMATMEMDLKPVDASGTDLFMRFNDNGGFGGYSIGEMTRFDAGQFGPPRFSGNGVSLTLGLQHCEGLPLSGAQPSYLSTDSIPLGRRLQELSNTDADDYTSMANNSNNISVMDHPPSAYENLSIQNRKRFAAQLLPDFVA